MKTIDNKIIVYVENGEFDKVRSHVCYENKTPKKIKPLTFVWYFLTSKRFRFWAVETIKYALCHYDCYRGYGASDVAMFKNNKHFHKVWKH